MVSPLRYSALSDVTNRANNPSSESSIGRKDSASGALDAQDHFALLGLVRQFDIHAGTLDSAWKRVALAVHPDRFATRSAAEKRVAMQWSSQANEAYRILKDPLSRARYLCELAGADLQTETNTAMAPEFLIQQMTWHEQLDELIDNPNDTPARQRFAQELSDAQEQIITAVSGHLDQGRYTLAAACVREWMFIHKLIAQCRAID